MTYEDLPPGTQETYADLDEVSKRAPLAYDGTILRFVKNRAICYAQSKINLNSLWNEASRNEWPLEDLMAFYRGMGYSLCGFLDLFEERIASERERITSQPVETIEESANNQEK